jgi:hypothetical protein
MSWWCGLGHGLLYDCMLLIMWMKTVCVRTWCVLCVRVARTWYASGACAMRVCTCVSVCVSSRPLEDCMLLMMWIRTWSIGGPRDAGGVD